MIIENTTIPTDAGLVIGSILIDEGKILKVKRTPLLVDADVRIDGNGLIALPGAVDVHVHFRDFDLAYKEDFYSGSCAAVAGGVTTVFDMPNTRPQTVDISSLLEKIISAKKRSYVDFGIYAAITNNNIGSINDLSKYCDGFKLFLGKTTNSIQLSEGNLYKALKETSSSNKTVLIHAESEQCLKQYTDVGEKNLIDHLNSRPAKCEEMSIKNIIEISKTIKSKIHICHLSSCEGLEALRGRPGNVSVGVTPYHLLFDVSKIKTNQPLYKVNPPIRTNFDRESLWSGIKTGEINVLESDHAPHTLEEKNTEFDKAPSGLPGVETMFPLFLALVKKEKISFNRLIDLMCEKPAELTNIPKGKIEKGRCGFYHSGS